MIKKASILKGTYRTIHAYLLQCVTKIEFFLRLCEESPSDTDICKLACECTSLMVEGLQTEIAEEVKKIPCNLSHFQTYCEAIRLHEAEPDEYGKEFYTSFQPVPNSKLKKISPLVQAQFLIRDLQVKMQTFLDLCFGLNAGQLLVPISTEDSEIPKVSEPSFILDCLYYDIPKLNYKTIILQEHDTTVEAELVRIPRLTETGILVSYVKIEHYLSMGGPADAEEEVVFPIIGVKVEGVKKPKDLHYPMVDFVAVPEIINHAETIYPQ